MSNYIERYWRDATPADAIKEPPMVARFKTDSIWVIGKTIGFRKSEIHKWLWYDSKGGLWTCCQVYDAPDPGEGWRLLDIDKDTKQEGDEYLHPDGTWKKADKAPFSKIRPYRRRITPTVTYVPFTWEDREQLRGRWIKESDNVEIQVTAFHCNSEGVFYSEGRSAKVLVERWRFLDTGKPVGKEVTQ